MQNEIRSLTALRGIAALWVVTYHYSHHTDLVFAKEFIGQGDLAVDIFFTLSGFILVHVYQNGFNSADFLAKRFARVYPVHFATLLGMIGMILIGKSVGFQVDGDIRLDDLFTHVFMLHAAGLTDGLALNYPSWSISAEAFAYGAFPVLFALVMRYQLKFVIPLVVVFFIFCYFIADITGRHLTVRTYDFSLIRIFPEFIIGMLAARMCLEKALSAILCLAITGLLMTIGLTTGGRILAVLAAPFLISFLFLSNFRVPETLRYLGLISYSLYMVHALVEKAVFTVLEIIIGEEILPSWTLIVAVGISIFVAYITYNLIEEPGRRLVLYIYRRLKAPNLKERVTKS